MVLNDSRFGSIHFLIDYCEQPLISKIYLKRIEQWLTLLWREENNLFVLFYYNVADRWRSSGLIEVANEQIWCSTKKPITNKAMMKSMDKRLKSIKPFYRSLDILFFVCQNFELVREWYLIRETNESHFTNKLLVIIEKAK